jgi:hypothetical protein
MSRFLRVCGWRVTTDAFDVRLGQWLCFFGAPAILIAASLKMPELSVTEREALLGILASLGVAISVVILGIVLPLAQRNPAEEKTT